MDVFGKALYGYYKGNRSQFCFVGSDGNPYPHPLDKYFRTPSKLTTLERKLIQKARGDILDVGCATAYYFPALMKKGNVTGIDVSKDAIKIATENGLHNCLVADAFTFAPKKKFDTITLLENNLGMAGTEKRARILLKKLTSLLKKDGQILTIARNVSKQDYFEIVMAPEWNGIRGKPFSWVSFNIKYLKQMCNDLHLKMTILGKAGSKRTDYLVQITKQ